MSYRINQNECILCPLCYWECPTGAIHKAFVEGILNSYFVQPEECTDCAACYYVCPASAISGDDDTDGPGGTGNGDTGGGEGNWGDGGGGGGGGGGVPTVQNLAAMLLVNSNVSPATTHSSGVADNATARQNLIDAANGIPSYTSCYGNAPCLTVVLSQTMLQGLQTLANNYTMSISEIAGGSHASNSSHYYGIAVDINYINGDHVGKSSMSYDEIDAFRIAAFNTGATKVFDPYHDPDGSHQNHFHIQW